jgi:hypothetical protein
MIEVVYPVIVGLANARTDVQICTVLSAYREQ